jgi:hypothetical protein
MAARRRRKKFKSKHTASGNITGKNTHSMMDIKNISRMPLPTTMVDCTLEIQILAERQRAVSTCLRELLRDANQEREKKESISSCESTGEQANASKVPETWNNKDCLKPTENSSSLNRNNARSTGVIDSNITQSESIIVVRQNERDATKYGDERFSKLYKSNISSQVIEAFCATDEEEILNEYSSPLIIALKQLQHVHVKKDTIKKWIRNLASLFFMADEDNSGYIDVQEYRKMISTLHLSDGLKHSLITKFQDIDIDNSGDINLEEFLHFFLLYPKFNEEVLSAKKNAPYNFEAGLTNKQKLRLRIFNIIEFPEYNAISKIMFYTDLILTLIPTVCLCIQGIRPSFKLRWGEKPYFWIISTFFAFQYICGLLTCKSKKRFFQNFWHIIDLISFVPWMICNTIVSPRNWNPSGFVVFRTLRLLKLQAIFDIRNLREDLEIYTDTMKLVYTSYGAVTGFMLCMIFFFSLLIYVFERGSYEDKKWVRDGGEESPFSNIFDCIYFTVVTMTTVGYGDMSPKSYVGKVIALISACAGICNLTFLINIIGECFEEMFREFVRDKSRKAKEELTLYIDKHILRASNQLKVNQGGFTDRLRKSVRV